ncbi:MAG: hypothetical protein LW625_05070 [Planctomycetaceae bacterium]|nr:hypothetical protein [Planctomycetaceae bacterium]
MRTVPACAAICTLSLAALASADIYVFDNAVAYQVFCNDMNVVTLGGNFFNLRADGTQKDGIMKIRLSDGTNFIRTVTNTTTFSGFVSDGLNITSVEISHAGSSAPNSFVASNGFSIGAVPAPGAMALIGLAGVLARRRRA